MGDLLARTWWMVVLRGVLAVLFGVAAIAWPGITVLVLVLLWGAYTLIDGVTAIALGIGTRDRGRWLMVVTGAFGILAGIVALVWPGITTLVLLLLIAFWAIVVGVGQLVAAWQLRGESGDWWLAGITGALAILLGILLLVQPKSGAVALVYTIGILAICWGLASMFVGWRLRGMTAAPA